MYQIHSTVVQDHSGVNFLALKMVVEFHYFITMLLHMRVRLGLCIYVAEKPTDRQCREFLGKFCAAKRAMEHCS